MPPDIPPPWEIPPTPWSVRHHDTTDVYQIVDASDDHVATIGLFTVAAMRHAVACVNLLAGVDPEAFPAIRDWLKSQGIAPMEDSPDAP
jgi:hypothetical protein